MVFLVCFFLMLDVRFVNPTISYGENSWTMHFCVSDAKNPSFPAGSMVCRRFPECSLLPGILDVRVSGYHHGGPLNITFNLALPTVFGLAAINLYAVGTLVIPEFRWLPLLVLFIPNPSFFFQIIQGKPFNTVLWDSTQLSATPSMNTLFSHSYGETSMPMLYHYSTRCFWYFCFFLPINNGNSSQTGQNGSSVSCVRSVWGLCLCSIHGMFLFTHLSSWYSRL